VFRLDVDNTANLIGLATEGNPTTIRFVSGLFPDSTTEIQPKGQHRPGDQGRAAAGAGRGMGGSRRGRQREPPAGDGHFTKALLRRG